MAHLISVILNKYNQYFINFNVHLLLQKITKENNGDPISVNINMVRITPKRYSINFSSSIVVYPHNTPVKSVALVSIDNNGLCVETNISLCYKKT